jgi:8-oxo-dGTP pyrophosphatase MutT (NUDIX family)
LNERYKIDWLKERLKAPLPGFEAQELMAARVKPMPFQIPDNARPSAVLIALFYVNGSLHTLLIKRTDDGKAHSGQVSFPGGRFEKTDESLSNTALREAYEEVGIVSGAVEILGGLTPLYIPVSNFMVHPFIGFLSQRPDYIVSHKEVAHIIELPIDELLHPERKTSAEVTSAADKNFRRIVPAYKLVDDSIIWGATAMIISELQVLFEAYED